MSTTIRLCIGLLLYGFLTLASAAEHSALETMRLAGSLDELVQRRGSFHPELFGKGQRLYAAAPVALDRIVPIAATMLKVDEGDLRHYLEDDFQPLSRIVFARLLGAKRNTAWKPLLINGEDLFQTVQNEIGIDQVYEVFNNLYTELAFASVDSPMVRERPRRLQTKRSR